MKKLLLLSSLALLLGGGAQAQKTVDVTSLFPSTGGWSSSAEGNVFTYEGAYAGCGYASWSSAVDLSTYGSVTAVVSNPSGITSAQVYVQYVEGVDTEEHKKNVVNDESGYMTLNTAGETTITCNLTCPNGWGAWQVIVQSAEAGSLTVEKFYFTEAMTYGTGKSLSFDEYGNILKSEFDGYPDNSKIEFTYTVTTVKGSASNLNGWGVGSIKDIGGTATGLSISKVADGDVTVSFTLADIKDLMTIKSKYSQYGIYWNMWGQEKTDNDGNVTDKVTITRKSAIIYKPTALRPITTNAQVISTDYYNLAGVKSSTPQKGLNIAVRTLSNGSKVTEKLLVK